MKRRLSRAKKNVLRRERYWRKRVPQILDAMYGDEMRRSLQEPNALLALFTERR